MKSEEPGTVPGVETIFSGDLPEDRKFTPHQIQYFDLVRQLFNAKGIALLPYCMHCRIPLRWYRNNESEYILSCDNCHARWKMLLMIVKDEIKKGEAKDG